MRQPSTKKQISRCARNDVGGCARNDGGVGRLKLHRNVAVHGRRLFSVFDYLRRGAYCYRVFWDVFGDYAVGSDYGSFADRDAGRDDNVNAYPAIFPDTDVPAVGTLLCDSNIPALVGVGSRDNIGVGRDPCVAADGDFIQAAAADSARAYKIHPVADCQRPLYLTIIYAAIIAYNDRACPRAETHTREIYSRSAADTQVRIAKLNQPYPGPGIRSSNHSREQATLWPSGTSVDWSLIIVRLAGHNSAWIIRKGQENMFPCPFIMVSFRVGLRQKPSL